MPCFLILPSGHAFFIRQINNGSDLQAQNIFSGFGVSRRLPMLYRDINYPFSPKIKIPPWKNEETNAPRYSLIAYSAQRSIGLLCRSTLLKMRFIIKPVINKQKEKTK